MTRGRAVPTEGAEDDECAEPGGELPRPSRLFSGRRWLIVVLRAWHLVAVMWLGVLLHVPAGMATGVPGSAAMIGSAVLLTGALMFVLDLYAYPWHLREVAGLTVLLKLALIALLVLADAWRLPIFWAVIVWSAVFSHAPASLRHRLVFPPAN